MLKSLQGVSSRMKQRSYWTWWPLWSPLALNLLLHMVSLWNLYSWKKKLKTITFIDTKWHFQKCQKKVSASVFSQFIFLTCLVRNQQLQILQLSTLTLHYFPKPSLNDFREGRDFSAPSTYHLIKVKSQLRQKENVEEYLYKVSTPT